MKLDIRAAIPSASSPMSLPLVRCAGLARTYGRGRSAVVALHDTSCEISDGQRIALEGPSGSGKSTLLHLFAGLDAPTSGTIEWPAFVGVALRPGPVAIVFQAVSLLPALNALENVSLPRLLAGADEATAREGAHAALRTLGLEGIAEKMPDELSGGQAQRVAIARALASCPRLLLADEPTGQLDHEAAAVVTDALIDAAAQSGAALVVATHDPDVAVRFACRWRMTDGRLLRTEAVS
jgi:ABC-type lipoprotein export system ATPase subunit